jgi:hypothetical protein
MVERCRWARVRRACFSWNNGTKSRILLETNRPWAWQPDIIRAELLSAEPSRHIVDGIWPPGSATAPGYRPQPPTTPKYRRCRLAGRTLADSQHGQLFSKACCRWRQTLRQAKSQTFDGATVRPPLRTSRADSPERVDHLLPTHIGGQSLQSGILSLEGTAAPASTRRRFPGRLHRRGDHNPRQGPPEQIWAKYCDGLVTTARRQALDLILLRRGMIRAVS